MSVQLQVPQQYQQVDLLYSKIMDEIKKMHESGKPKMPGTFAEPQNDFNMSLGGGLFTVERGNLLVMALGAALSGVVGGLISRFLPSVGINGLPQIIAGIIGKKFIGKSGALQDFFNGVLIAGVALLLSGFVGGIGGGTATTSGTMFGEARKAAFREPSYGTTPTVQVRGTGVGMSGYTRPVVF